MRASGISSPPDVRASPALPPLHAYHDIGTARQLSWSGLRRQVLSLLWKTRSPWGAYAIADKLRRPGKKSHPNSIYRSLRGMEVARLVIPIISWSRYVISPDPAVHSWSVILCSRCRSYAVVPMEEEGRRLWSVARGFNFTPEQATIECQAKCTACAMQER